MFLSACPVEAPTDSSPPDEDTSGSSTTETETETGDPPPTCPEAGAADITLETGTGALAGTLTTPAGCGPFPVVLIHAGSGPTDRDGNTPLIAGRNDSLLLLSGALAERGVASLRYDKRGVAASVPAAPMSEAEMTFDVYVEDAVAWVDLLAADPRFDGVWLAGHSEGSLIGMVAASEAPLAGYISLAGTGRPAGEILRQQLAAQLPEPLLTEANHIIDELEAGNFVEDVPEALSVLFRPSAQPYLISWFKYDPAQVIGGLTSPTLVVQGTTDVQVGVEDAERLVAAKPDAEYRLLDGMCHVLKPATLDQTSQDAAYSDPTIPLMPGLADALVSFLQPR